MTRSRASRICRAVGDCRRSAYQPFDLGVELVAGTTSFRSPAACAVRASNGSPVSAHSFTRRRGAIDCSSAITCIGTTPTFTWEPENYLVRSDRHVGHAQQAHAARHADPANAGIAGLVAFCESRSRSA